MRKITLFVAALLMAAGALAQENEPKQIELTKEEAQLVRSNNDFAFRLFREARTAEAPLQESRRIAVQGRVKSADAAGLRCVSLRQVLEFSRELKGLP